MAQRRMPRKYTTEFRQEAVALVTTQGWTCLAFVVGLHSRRIVGWAMSKSM